MIKAIIRTGLLAGTLDAAAAIVNYVVSFGRNPIRVFIYIASGVFGEDAYNGDALMPVWGILFHYTIAFGWTLLFFLLYPRIGILSRNRFITGTAYGIFVWLVMTRVVVPLSNVQKFPFNLTNAIVGVVILIICIGLPISLMAARYYFRKPD